MAQSRIEGLSDLAKALREMPEDLSKNALRAGMRAGAATIRDEARLKVPILTGRLREAVYLKQVRELSSRLTQVFFVGVRTGPKRKKNKQTGAIEKDYSRDAWYWRFIEFGTRFMSARPFLRPAFERKKEAAVAAIAARLKVRIDKWGSRK
ncbi:MAG: HK97 gp10 family phage protein [Phycisphaerales bacterium]|nr:HK97 gp10 family phage protein [Phycisphaerales bacterium]